MFVKNFLRSILTHTRIRSVLRRFQLPEAIYRSLHFRDTIDIVVPATGRSFRIQHHGYQVENDLYWAGFGRGWEAHELNAWVALARDSQIIFDIGANTGVYALSAGAANPSASIHAFEPMSNVAQKLRTNVGFNPYDLTVIETALSSRTGKMTFFEPATEHAYSATLDSAMAQSVGATIKRTVEVLRFDEYVTAIGAKSVDLVKIDAERHEPDVLSGFGDVLARFRPILLIEVLDAEIGRKIMPFFEDQNYRRVALDGSGQIDGDEVGSTASNYLFFPQEKIDATLAALK